jgi:cell fate regulator YaaT (PSP1 superfamily)
MAGIAGIKFENSSKIYGFRAEELELKKGDRVVVESEMGMSLGRVVSTDFAMESPDREIKPVLRKATGKDLDKLKENEEHKAEARTYCLERIMARGLPMKLIATDVTLDRKRYIFYFVAEARIDFRELVKDLASKFRTRIELRQIGIRDAAMITGGLGVCGREFCCKGFLKGFFPISIKMAKKQDLVLNTAKLSGACGRLMCCLNFEYEDYPRRQRKKIPEKAPARPEKPKEEKKDKAEATAKAEKPTEEKRERGEATAKAEATAPERAEATAKAEATAPAGEEEKTDTSGAKKRKPRRKRWRKRRKKK